MEVLLFGRRMVLRYCLHSCFVVLLAAASRCGAAETVSLDHAAIVTDASQPSYVEYGVEDLAGYLKDLTGKEIAVVTTPGISTPVRILVGTKAAGEILPETLSSEKLGETGYWVKAVSRNEVKYVVAAGSAPSGTKAALGVLMKAIQTDGQTAFVPGDLDLSGKPALSKRGLHFNGWAFNYPYSFRSWREDDWHRYLDILAYQGINLFYLWPFIEIMPVPLSPEDQAYLEECRRVVDYAQQKHGMEVWIMQCTNRVAKDRCGVADPRLRPYWRPSQEDLNPGNPEHFQAIMTSREAMYRVINNADGVCNIDSDPGFCPGSPLSDYIKVLQGFRDLLDQYNIHGKDAKLINWMLWGWGRKDMSVEGLAEHQRTTVQSIKQGLREPWELICSQFGFIPADQHMFLPICQEEGVLGKAVFLPYGIIEFEPSYPKTNLEIDGIRDTFEQQVYKFPQLGGAMGNVQTPLLQFPDVYFFTSVMFDAECRNRTEAEVLLDLAGYIYPAQKRLLAECYLAMKEPDPSKVAVWADRLADALQKDQLGRGGLFGRKLFPDSRIVAQSLVLQLRLRAAQEALVLGVSPTTPQAACEQLLYAYFDAYLAWDTAHGWHNLWGWQKWAPSDARFDSVAEKLRATLGGKSAVDASLDHVAQKLSAKYDASIVQEGCIAHWKKK
ncbi:MAG TPA: hypothetical protein PLI09_12280 [Candidatus Hydrogenedentes bacterium]|nr:hypothetical protein [Candidatus Hydrogenedentota bacterium]